MKVKVNTDKEFNETLNTYYGDKGHTYKYLEDAILVLRHKGYSKITENIYSKKGKKAFITRIRKAIYRKFDDKDDSETLAGFKTKEYLITYEGRFNPISDNECIIRQKNTKTTDLTIAT